MAEKSAKGREAASVRLEKNSRRSARCKTAIPEFRNDDFHGSSCLPVEIPYSGRSCRH